MHESLRVCVQASNTCGSKPCTHRFNISSCSLRDGLLLDPRSSRRHLHRAWSLQHVPHIHRLQQRIIRISFADRRTDDMRTKRTTMTIRYWTGTETKRNLCEGHLMAPNLYHERGTIPDNSSLVRCHGVSKFSISRLDARQRTGKRTSGHERTSSRSSLFFRRKFTSNKEVLSITSYSGV